MNLDPVEVLHHLHLLGYRNVTEKQLIEFIRDLKKLIKYELRKKEKLLEEIDTSSEVGQSKENRFINFHTVNSVKKIHTIELRNETEDSCSASIVSTSSGTPSLVSEKSTSSRENGSRKFGTEELSKDNARKLPAPKISHPSYIRSRSTQKTPDLKNDPVARYHWYQSQWNNFKVPGEEAHSQLRWHVRERMLGEDPNPRPRSMNSGRCSRNSNNNKYLPR